MRYMFELKLCENAVRDNSELLGVVDDRMHILTWGRLLQVGGDYYKWEGIIASRGILLQVGGDSDN